MIQSKVVNGQTVFFVADDLGMPISFGYPTEQQAVDVANLIESSEGNATIPAGVDVTKMASVTDLQIEILCVITTRDAAGVHFTSKFNDDDLAALETAGLIEISRPVHQPSGVAFGCDQWTVEVTAEGLALVEANPELHPADDDDALTVDDYDLTEIDSVAECIADGVATVEELNELIDSSAIVDGCLVLESSVWITRDEGGENSIAAMSQGDAIEATKAAYTDPGFWDFHIYQNAVDSFGEIVEVRDKRVEFRVDENEPECTDGGEHDWDSPHEIVGGLKENPGVFGNGGGVIVNECCMVCGCKRTTDTWATNQTNGTQGHEVVSYEPGFYLEQINEAE